MQKNQTLQEAKKLREKMKEAEHRKLILLWTFTEQKSFPEVMELQLATRTPWSGIQALRQDPHLPRDLTAGLTQTHLTASATAIFQKGMAGTVC